MKLFAGKENQTVTKEELQQQLQVMLDEHRHFCEQGQVVDYIPELGQADPCHLAVSVCFTDGSIVEAGESNEPFTMQSVSKVLTLALALIDAGEDEVFSKVGMEPSGDPFHSIARLEISKPNKPHNPMINAGAIAVTSLIAGHDPAAKIRRILEFVRRIAGNDQITVNEKVARSELESSNLNRSLAYFMKEHHVLAGHVEDILNVYVHHCAIQVCSRDLATIGAVLALNGQHIHTREQLIPVKVAQICRSFMVTCGMYDESGEFALQVGIPAKSGVSGGILGAVPNQLGLGVYGPSLDAKGNSVAGFHLLKKISERWDLRVY